MTIWFQLHLFCRLKGKDMLELIRGKRLVIVGDSLNRNMWDSLMCILRNSVEDKSRAVRNHDTLVFKVHILAALFLQLSLI